MMRRPAGRHLDRGRDTHMIVQPRSLRARLRSLIGRLAVVSIVALALSPVGLHAQRQMSWDALDVSAHLGDDGTLDIVETQTMLVSGDWNGGQRGFNLRPRQHLTIVGIERIDAAIRATVEKLGARRIRVALSHGHLDHIAGNAVFGDCEIIAHRLTGEALAR